MKYLCLIYVDADKLAATPADECLAYAAELQEQGRCLAAEALRDAPGATIKLREGELSVTDGPFAETKEFLAGFCLLEVSHPDEAVALASKIPPLNVGRVELRPVLETAVWT